MCAGGKEPNSDSASNPAADGERKTAPAGTSGLPPAVSLPILVFIDMFAVALVVPLLFQYYKKAGVTSATQRELLSSVFSASQIIGGILLGALTDAKLLRRKTLLFLSFGGSAVAYLMITFGGFRALVLSRVIVGLVKQTMTVTTSILTQCTTKENRTKDMGRLESSMTAAWILGPSTGALLFKHVGHEAPALLASVLFVLNMVLAGILLKGDIEDGCSDAAASSSSSSSNDDDDDETTGNQKKRERGNFLDNIKSCFTSQSLTSVVACLLIYSWVARATSYSSMGSYYEEMYGVETHYRGYIQSYQRVIAFVVQSALLQPVLRWLGGERRAVVVAAVLLASCYFLESRRNVGVFLGLISPSISLSMTLMSVSLRSLLTQFAPKDAVFSVFAALDVLQNASAVTVPFYRAALFRFLDGRTTDESGASSGGVHGDPDPVVWVLCSGLHWAVASACMLYLLRPARPFSETVTTDKKDR
eukprot:CAMPEP_0197174486 /NCGR_PEP_ID=MMETSP1423-20130617/987_1 /TAXON_ID=476441 /ORGANISM="Pseudo-nitzschia heimii, Strain UNC1101" /LENGTH=475 /DNA_ID=CAMNT_0042623427 /DNA_START=101 /DNA_END=1528 /DNA_ORIENTATION=+